MTRLKVKRCSWDPLRMTFASIKNLIFPATIRIWLQKRVFSGWATFLCNEGFHVLPRDSLWYINYVKNPRVHDTRFCDSFCWRCVSLSSTILMKMTKHFCVGTTWYRMPWVQGPIQFLFYCWQHFNKWAMHGLCMTCTKIPAWVLKLSEFSCTSCS